MHRGEQIDAQMDEWDQERSKNSQDGRIACAHTWRVYRPAQDDIRNVDKPQKEGEDQAHVPPRPVCPPNRLGPHWTGDQYDRREDHSDFRRAFGKTVEPRISKPEE